MAKFVEEILGEGEISEEFILWLNSQGVPAKIDNGALCITKEGLPHWIGAPDYWIGTPENSAGRFTIIKEIRSDA